MRLKYAYWACATVLVLAFATLSVSARGQVWGFLGGTQVRGHGDHDTIEVTRRDVAVSAIQVRISGEPIFVDRLVVQFGKGASKQFALGDRILPEGKSYVIDLPHEFQTLESVEVWYYREPGKANPKVSLYGTTDKSQLDAVATGQYFSRLR